MVYNRYDNLVYYCDITHKNYSGTCTAPANYIQMCCLDTNMQLKWIKYFNADTNTCLSLGKVSACDGRSGVLVAGISSLTSNPSDTSKVFTFIYRFDSAGNLNVQHEHGVNISDRLSIYPNPAHNLLYVKDIKGQGGYLSIRNANGKEILEKVYTSGQPLDISVFPPGLFLVLVSTDDGYKQSFKLIKDH